MTAQEIIVDQLRKKWKAKGWNVTANLEEIPESTGVYALFDGIQIKASGVTFNMRKSIASCTWFGKCEIPIFMWMPDMDGSVEEWLKQ
jgi:hypothetical protein